jgi:AcrR family transcriptional regulator
MARQARSEATRRKLLNAAIDVFNEVGYTAAGRGEIIERAGLTKGALYHHFDSMESLTAAIIDEGAEVILNNLRGMAESSSPAMENMVHGTFLIADLFAADKIARAAEQLMLASGTFNDTVARVYAGWLAAMAAEARRATAEGDLRGDLEADAVSESITAAMFGTRLLSQATASGDLVGRLSRMWELLLPALVTETSLPYFRQFVAREALRHRSSVPRSTVAR